MVNYKMNEGHVVTNIQNELLKALMVGGDFKDQHYLGVYNSGHGRKDAERQILSYIVRQALKIVRLPYRYEFLVDIEHFRPISMNDLTAAVDEAVRIYNHTQEHYKNEKNMTISLRRGLSYIEAAAFMRLFEIAKNQGKDSIDYFFSTIIFFNYLTSPFAREVKITIDCPVSWIWCSAYTVEELRRNSPDDEFWVACLDPMGTLKVPLNKITIHGDDFREVHKSYPEISYILKENEYELVLSNLTKTGLKIINKTNRAELLYSPGSIENLMATFGRWLDRLLGQHGHFKIKKD